MPRAERPLDPGDSPLLRFAADLRRLRAQAGGPTYRVLAERAHYSAAALSGAASGRQLPSMAVALAYARACGGDVRQWERRWREVAAELAAEATARETAGAEEGECAPYAGLAAFRAQDADWFFGRERLVEELAARLRGQRFVALFGASGAGKSSLLRAGLLPCLRTRSPRCVPLLFTPGGHPLEECAIHLAPHARRAPGRLRSDLLADHAELNRVLRQIAVQISDEAEVVVVVDQFEEVFTVCGSERERAAFITALVTAAHAPNSRCRVVLGIRADFYPHCTQHAQLVEALCDAQVTLGPMTSCELHRAIVQPAVRAGCRVEGALLAALTAQVHGQVGMLPLLSHALLETWRRRQGTTLSLAGYQAAGGLDGALTQSAEALYAALTEHQQRLARELFLRLTALGEGTEDTKRRIPRSELDETADTAAILDRAARARLLTLDRGHVEITHEALIRSWPRLRRWLAEDRDRLRLHRQLTEAAQEWEALGRDPGALYRGTRLALAKGLLHHDGTTLTVRERAFLDAGLSTESAESAAVRRRARRLRQLVALLAVFVVLSAAAALYTVGAERRATDERNSALARKAVAQAVALQVKDPALAAQLRLAAHRLAPQDETRDSVLGTSSQPYTTRLTGHHRGTTHAAFSPDGTVVATTSMDRTTKLWDVRNRYRPRELSTLRGHTATVQAAAFRADGRVLATVGWDRTVRLWDVTDPRQPRRLSVVTGHSADISALAFHPTGSLLATAGQDGTARLWDVADPRRPRTLAVLRKHRDNVSSVAFSPSGKTLATADHDATTHLWDVTLPARPRHLTTLASAGYATAFSPDGKTLATAGTGRTIQLWDITTVSEPRARTASLAGHTDVINALAFSPDGEMLASAGTDDTVRIWLTAGPGGPPTPLTVLTGHTDMVSWAAFSPDGTTLATASDDYSVRLEDLRALTARHTDIIYSVAFSPDGRVLATGSADHTVRLWDVTDPAAPTRLAVLTGQGEAVHTVAFSPDGRLLAAGGAAHTIQLWDVTHPRRPEHITTLPGPTGTPGGPGSGVMSVAFHPGGRLLASGGTDRTIRLWDLTHPARPRRLAAIAGHTGSLTSVSFHPGGTVLAAGGVNSIVRLWDVTDPRNPGQLRGMNGHTDVTGLTFASRGDLLVSYSADRTLRLRAVTPAGSARELSVLRAHSATLQDAAFSPDGTSLASVGNDQVVRLWDTAAPRHPVETARLTGHTAKIYSVAFHPRGALLATTDADGSLKLWDTDLDRVTARICRTVHPVITRAQWNRYFPGVAYTPPCAELSVNHRDRG
ncbi:hypothetical protein CP973_20170 [Streptomyces albofaciens JCM 4342]|uniref:WD40 repeat domain-containing protein n=1 Tax=Streptomyces albofaciens TaxID=66866 RepID=UPI001239C0DB|nr:WD40 repeat domain-containing protein [Streptomyces albofaciens]KAA6223927.1 hypothetical protein CP973_20170 [Streptomyces albofaciens JCM 4342]